MFFPHTQVPGHVLCLLRYLYVLGFIRYVTQGKIPNPESRCTARESKYFFFTKSFICLDRKVRKVGENAFRIPAQ